MRADDPTNEAEIPVMDMTSALKRLRGDHELLHELIAMFLEDAPDLLQAMRHAAQVDDAASLQRAAHSLKGLAANFDASETVAAAQLVENVGTNGDLSLATHSIDLLKIRVDALRAALQSYLNDHTQ